MRSDRKQTIIFIIILLILSMGIGYAYLTTTLSIDGISDIDSASWDVHWANVQVKSGSVSGTQVTQAPTISANGTTVSYHINLKNPGEYYEFTVDAVNAGSLDAMIESIRLTEDGHEIEIGDTPSYLIQTITYDDDIEIEENQLLASGDTEKYKFRLEYKTNLGEEDVHDDISLDYSFNVTYSQANSSATKVREFVYTTSDEWLYIGQPIPENVMDEIYDNPEDAMIPLTSSMFIRHKLVKGIIRESHVGFVVDDTTYYVKGGDNGESFEDNKATLIEAFGESNCGYDPTYTDYFTCSVKVRGGHQLPPTTIVPNGSVSISGINNRYCDIDSAIYNGLSHCYEDFY